MIQLTENIFAVPVPDDAENLRIEDCCLIGYKVVKYLPVRKNWELLFTTSTIDEEKAKMVVEFTNKVVRGYKDYCETSLLFSTATESFQSLLYSKGLNGNYAILKKVKN